TGNRWAGACPPLPDREGHMAKSGDPNETTTGGPGGGTLGSEGEEHLRAAHWAAIASAWAQLAHAWSAYFYVSAPWRRFRGFPPPAVARIRGLPTAYPRRTPAFADAAACSGRPPAFADAAAYSGRAAAFAGLAAALAGRGAVSGRLAAPSVCDDGRPAPPGTVAAAPGAGSAAPGAGSAHGDDGVPTASGTRCSAAPGSRGTAAPGPDRHQQVTIVIRRSAALILGYEGNAIFGGNIILGVRTHLTPYSVELLAALTEWRAADELFGYLGHGEQAVLSAELDRLVEAGLIV